MKLINTLKALLLMALATMAMACSSDDASIAPTPEPAEPLLLTLCGDNMDETLISSQGAEVVVSLYITADKPATESLRVALNIDSGSGGLMVLEEAVTMPEPLTLAVGEQQSERVTLLIDGSKLKVNQIYHLGLYASVEEGDAQFVSGGNNLALTVERTAKPRTMRQILYFEVNNCNPLNALEYRLEDGSPFFDAVVLFAANINYNADEDRVYLHCNPNVQALLDNSEELLQPLRRAGIKVYLGLLGNHDAAGLAQLSAWGAQTWAQEVAEVCNRYGLDGVNLDDEYSKSPDLSNSWFTMASAGAGARLAYELKKALREQCSWPTEVSIFECGKLQNLPVVLADGGSHPQSEFIDILVPNYGSASVPYGDLTYAHCAGASIELNYNQTLAEGYARSILNQGFGWCMWFGFDPSGSGGVKSNLERSLQQFQTAARIFYEQELCDPTCLYHKLGEGSYDPEPHPVGN